MSRAIIFVAVALLAAISTAFAAELSIKTSDGKGADAYVSGRDATVNAGAGAAMAVAAQPTAGRKGYVRFDLSDVKEPIKGAVLYLTVGKGTNSGIGEFNVYGLNDGADEAWVEGKGSAKEDATSRPEDGINYQNAPGNDAKRVGGPADKGGGVDPAKTTFLGTFVVDNAGYKLDSKPQAIAFGSEKMVEFLGKDSNKMVTFIITRVGTSQTAMTNFITKEAKDGAKLCPVLKVSSEALPFPVQPSASQPASAPAKPADTKPAKTKG